MWIFYKGVHFSPFGMLFKNLKIEGENVSIGANTYFGLRNRVTMKGNNQIAPNCAILTRSSIDGKVGDIVIEDGACIGANSVILPGVVVGRNSIIGAGAVVTFGTKIPSGEIWVGVPAKFKKKRSTDMIAMITWDD